VLFLFIVHLLLANTHVVATRGQQIIKSLRPQGRCTPEAEHGIRLEAPRGIHHAVGSTRDPSQESVVFLVDVTGDPGGRGRWGRHGVPPVFTP